MTLPERIEQIIREWPHWSDYERNQYMPQVIEQVFEHLRDGTGNRFIAKWCSKVLMPELQRRRVYLCRVCGKNLGWDAPSGVCSEKCLREGQGFSPAQS